MIRRKGTIETREIVTILYEKLLCRLPGQPELEYWTAYFESHSFSEIYNAFVESDEFRSRNELQPGHPPGHYYSPVVDPRIIDTQKLIRPLSARDIEILGISLDHMIEFWSKNIDNIASCDFPEKPIDGCRFYFDNPVYSYADAIMLRAMLLVWRPRRIVEIGCGFSSSVMLDTIEQHGLAVDKLVFIDPYPDRLKGLLKPSDYAHIEIIEKSVQSATPAIFEELQENDILFVDSTHVMKTQSDVCALLFDIIPSIAPGALIHFHDIFYPFEYPLDWIVQRRYSWNEIYGLRLFLMYNSEFRIEFFNNMFGQLCHDLIEKTCPLYLNNIGGSIWLRREQRHQT
jgi:Methyltransferase domain/Domain of unknown function (DUF4214)